MRLAFLSSSRGNPDSERRPPNLDPDFADSSDGLAVWRHWQAWLLLLVESVALGAVLVNYSYLVLTSDKHFSFAIEFLLILPLYLVDMVHVPVIWLVNVRWPIIPFSWPAWFATHTTAAGILACARIATLVTLRRFEIWSFDL